MRMRSVVFTVLAMGAADVALAAVAGRVVGSDGTPVAGATVEAFAHEDDETLGERRVAGKGPTPLATAKTGVDGTFRLDTAAAVAWIHALADGHLPAVAQPDDAVPVQIRLEPGARTRGVVRAGGRPVAGAIVIWSAQKGGERLAVTDTSGAYEAPDPDALDGIVAVYHRDFAPHSDNAQAAKDLDIALDAGVRIDGRAADAAGQPVPNAVVWVDGSWPLARSDAKGAFTVAHAPSDWSTLTVRTATAVGTVARKAGAAVVTLGPARSLSGRVTDAATGRPVAGAVVVATASDVERTAATDTQGRYTIAGVPAGLVRVYAGRVGYESGPDDYAQAKPIDLRRTAAGRFDVALARLRYIAGRVVDEQGRPIDGAQVTVGMKDGANLYVADSLSMYSQRGTPPGTSALDGTFALPMPKANEGAMAFLSGEPALVVRKRGYAAAQLPSAAYTNAKAPVVVTLPRGIALHGVVTDAAGAPVAGVDVTAAEDGVVASMFPSHVAIVSAGAGGWAATDAAGRFEIRVNPGLHHVLLRKPGFAPRLVRGHDPRGGAALEVRVEPAAFVRGRLTRADGRGVAGAYVEVASPDGDAIGSGQATTAEDGTFAVTDLSPGQYVMRVRHDDLAIAFTRGVEAPVADLQIALDPTVTVRGAVLDAATRAPVPRFDVTVEQGTDDAPAQREAAGLAGAFAIDDVAAGPVRVRVSAEGYADWSLDGLDLKADEETEPLQVLLEADAPIRGRVTGADGGLAEALVTANDRQNRSVATDERGDYEMRGLPPGEIELSFSAEGYVAEKRTTDTRQPARVDVTLKRGLALTGVVVDNAGAGQSHTFVGAHTSAAGGARESTQTDVQGRFTITGLVPGRYQVQARSMTGGSAERKDVDPTTSGPLRLVLEKGATGTITGRVVGLPEGDVAMSMVMAGNEEGQMSRTTLEGGTSFRMTDAPAGRVRVQATAMLLPSSMRRTRPVEVTLAPGGEAEVVLEFANDDITIAGRVTRDGAGVPQAMVMFSDGNSSMASGSTDSRGFYKAVGVEPGRQNVMVMGERISYAMPYVVTGSADLDIDVTGGMLTGRVVSADTREPLADVSVLVFRPGEDENAAESTATTGGQGTFAERSLREGPVRLVTYKEGFGQEVRDVEIPRGGSVDVPIELTPADGLGVTVVDARDGRTLEAIVVVRDASRRIVANQHAGADATGAVRIPLADGAYRLYTSATGYGTATLAVTAPSQGLRVALTPGGTLVIESARELRGRVRLVQPDGEEYVRCWCNGIADIELKGRRTTVENVTPGQYTLEIVDAPEATQPRPVVVQEGQTSTIMID